MQYATWLRRQLAYLNGPPAEYVADDLALVIAEARDRATKAGLPVAVEACQIRGGPVGVELARRILTACLRDAIDHEGRGGGQIETEPGTERPLTAVEAANILNISTSQLYNLCKEGRIAHTKNPLRILPQAIRDYQSEPAKPLGLRYLA